MLTSLLAHSETPVLSTFFSQKLLYSQGWGRQGGHGQAQEGAAQQAGPQAQVRRLRPDGTHAYQQDLPQVHRRGRWVMIQVLRMEHGSVTFLPV